MGDMDMERASLQSRSLSGPRPAGRCRRRPALFFALAGGPERLLLLYSSSSSSSAAAALAALPAATPRRTKAPRLARALPLSYGA